MHTLQIIQKREAERSDMSFNGVAPVAKKPSRASSIVAMICARVNLVGNASFPFAAKFKLSFANGAAVFLQDQKIVVDFRVHTGSPLSEASVMGVKKDGVGFNLSPLVLFVLIVFSALLVGYSLSLNLGLHIVGTAAFLGFLGFVVSLGALNNLVAIALVPFTTVAAVGLFLLIGHVSVFYQEHLLKTMKLTTTSHLKDCQL